MENSPNNALCKSEPIIISGYMNTDLLKVPLDPGIYMTSRITLILKNIIKEPTCFVQKSKTLIDSH